MCRLKLAMMLWCLAVVPGAANDGQPAALAAAPKEKTGRRDGAWADPNKAEPAGTKYRTFHSQTIHAEVSYLIYLPPDYEKEQPKRYPVLYWLHGSGATQSKGGEIVRRVDQAIRDGKVLSMIVVLVNGLRGATMYCDTKDGKWPLESVIVNDLIPHIDATYRTTARRQGRAIEGFSMGGFGAAHFGFKYPELFGVVSILAPALLGPDLTAEMPKRKWLEHLSFVFSGDIDCFQANDPFQLVVKNAERIRGQCIIRLVPHDEEGKWLIPRCEELHALLEKYKIAHEFDPRTDVTAHNYRLLYDKMGDKALGFYAKAFAVAAQAGDWKLEQVEVRNGIEIYQCQRPGKPEFRRLLAKPRGEGPFPAVVLNHGGRSGAPFLYRCLAFPENGGNMGSGLILLILRSSCEVPSTWEALGNARSIPAPTVSPSTAAKPSAQMACRSTRCVAGTSVPLPSHNRNETRPHFPPFPPVPGDLAERVGQLGHAAGVVAVVGGRLQ